MRYSIGDCLGEYGFQFYEQLREPILLFHKSGKIVKQNQAARKLLKIARLAPETVEKIIFAYIEKTKTKFRWHIPTRHKNVTVVTRELVNSDYYLIEIFH